MKIVFMGTPDFAAASLEKLVSSGYDLPLVITQPDKPRGRGMEIAFSAVKKVALDHGLVLYQPEKINTPESVEKIKEINPDIIVVVAYGKIISTEILGIPKYGCINVHGSLLPKYRGAAPIQWAVLNGDKTTGVTTMYLAEEMDSGDIIYQTETEIGEFETAGELFDRLMYLGADLLVKTLQDIENGTAPRHPQNSEEASYVHQLDKSLSAIDWNNSPRSIIKKIYGLQPWPVATADIAGMKLKIFAANYTDTVTSEVPGKILKADKFGIEIACGDGESILITQVQAPGKKRMSAGDYLRGHPIEV